MDDISSLPHFYDPRYCVEKHGSHLPHWQQEGSVVFVTFRLGDSLPAHVVRDLERERSEWLAMHPQPWNEALRQEYDSLASTRLERFLDQGLGTCLLREPELRERVVESIQHFHGRRYVLHAFVVMPNHVHLLLSPVDGRLSTAIGDIKSYTSHVINRMLREGGRSESFMWQREVFDHLVRNAGEFLRYVEYIRENPSHLPADSYTLYVNPDL